MRPASGWGFTPGQLRAAALVTAVLLLVALIRALR